VRCDSHVTQSAQSHRDPETQTLIQTNHSKLHCAAPLVCETRQSIYISKGNRDTDSHTHTATQTFTKTSHSRLPGAAPSGGARCDSQLLSRHQTHNLQDFKAKAKADSTFPDIEKAADSTFAGVEKAINRSAAFKSTKRTRHTVSGVDSIACSAIGVCSVAFIHLMLDLHLGCREGIHMAATRPPMVQHHSRRLVTPSWCRLRYIARSQILFKEENRTRSVVDKYYAAILCR